MSFLDRVLQVVDSILYPQKILKGIAVILLAPFAYVGFFLLLVPSLIIEFISTAFKKIWYRKIQVATRIPSSIYDDYKRSSYYQRVKMGKEINVYPGEVQDDPENAAYYLLVEEKIVPRFKLIHFIIFLIVIGYFYFKD